MTKAARDRRKAKRTKKNHLKGQVRAYAKGTINVYEYLQKLRQKTAEKHIPAIKVGSEGIVEKIEIKHKPPTATTMIDYHFQKRRTGQRLETIMSMCYCLALGFSARLFSTKRNGEAIEDYILEVFNKGMKFKVEEAFTLITNEMFAEGKFSGYIFNVIR